MDREIVNGIANDILGAAELLEVIAEYVPNGESGARIANMLLPVRSLLEKEGRMLQELSDPAL